RWMESVEFVEVDDFTSRFPAERLAVATLELDDGSSVRSAPTTARGGKESPLTDDEVFEKFRSFARREIRPRHIDDIVRAVVDLRQGADTDDPCDAGLRESA